ncbi:chromosome segregation protein ParM [Streptomyces sp. NPDC006654]|uniref:chromosome segregation protein ParM n=1 Tax=Streptomyces sp. NPDC006654 TaxID=3156897 RepID=UPI0033E9185E
MSSPRPVVLERLAYTLAAPALAVAPNVAPGGAVNTSILLAGAAGAAGTFLAAKSDEPGAGRKILRWTPLTLAAAVDIAARHTTGWGPMDLDAWLAAGWLAAGWTVLPFSRLARRRHRPALATPVPQLAEAAPAPQPAPVPDDGASTFTRAVRQLWERAGNPGKTIVIKAIPHDGMPHDLTMLLRAADEGRPIGTLTEAAVAAAFGITDAPGTIHFAAVEQLPGRQGGPGWLEVHITPDAALRRRTAPTPAQKWADTIGQERGAIPGSVYVDRVRDSERGVTFVLARMDDPHREPRIDQAALATAMGAAYDDGRVFATVDGPDILVAVWDSSPLAAVYPATRDLLTPDSDGRWVCGYLTNGQAARQRVYTDRGAAHGLITAPSGGGKTQLMGLFVAADSLFGKVVWLATEAPDEKTAALGKHCDRYGVGPLYMVRMSRALIALMEIRGDMLWADGERHDWDPNRPGCPYRPLSAYLDEFLSAARDETYGAELMTNTEIVSVKGRKYGVGETVAGQSVYVQDGFTQLLCENLRENCIPIVLKVAPKKIMDMFKSLGVAPDDIPEPLPRSFSPAEAGRIERIMAGQPEPPSDSNTGGAGWIIEGKHPEVLRTLFMDFSAPIDHLFSDTVHGLTDHEIRELEARDLWFDWNEPPRPGEFGPEPGDEDGDDGAPRRRGSSRTRQPTARRDSVTTARQALEKIKHLTS